jgi:ketosteroid isomerase-like protein
MGEAREVLNRVTEKVFSNDREGLSQLYAPDAVGETPDQGTVQGRDAVVDWALEFLVAFPDAKYESVQEHEAGNTAIDEGYFVGTNTGPLRLPDGEVPATGKSVRVRACDCATVENGLVTSHRFYFDQMDFMTQLGLVPEEQAASG